MDVTSYLLGKKNGGGTPTLQTKSVSYTSNNTYQVNADTGYDGLEQVNVTVNVPQTAYPDWTQIGYQETPQTIIDGYNYAKEIYDNWDASQTYGGNKFENDKNLIIMPAVDASNMTTMSSMFKGCDGLLEVGPMDTSNTNNMSSMFSNCYNLKKIPLLNTSNVTNISYIFNNCYTLKYIPILNSSKFTNMTGMFYNCKELSDESLDNILQMCIDASSYSGTKTLSNLGMSSTYYSASKIQALPHYQDFIDAGWTIGY